MPRETTDACTCEPSSDRGSLCPQRGMNLKHNVFSSCARDVGFHAKTARIHAFAFPPLLSPMWNPMRIQRQKPRVSESRLCTRKLVLRTARGRTILYTTKHLSLSLYIYIYIYTIDFYILSMYYRYCIGRNKGKRQFFNTLSAISNLTFNVLNKWPLHLL